MGSMYYEGKGTAINYGAAVNWYTMAANKDSAKAQFNLGVMYLKGASLQKAKKHLHQATKVTTQKKSNKPKRLHRNSRNHNDFWPWTSVIG